MVALAMVLTINSLLDDPQRRSFAGHPEADLLTERDALQEADLVELRLEAGQSRLVVLFDLRQALQFRDANTAVLALSGVEKVKWSGDSSNLYHRMAHPIMSSVPDHSGGKVRLLFFCLRETRLEIEGLSAEFFVGTVATLPEAPPNFVEDDEFTIAAGMPSWSSRFEPGWATFLDSEI